jgi:predicted nucleic acid-binding protein
MANLLLDSNILILHLRKRASATEFLLQWGGQDNLHISVATRTELLAGMRPREEGTTIHLLNSLRNLPVSDAIADLAGRLIYRLARTGVQLSFPDALIAATAITHDLAIITTNAVHFTPTGAKCEPWTPA